MLRCTGLYALSCSLLLYLLATICGSRSCNELSLLDLFSALICPRHARSGCLDDRGGNRRESHELRNNSSLLLDDDSRRTVQCIVQESENLVKHSTSRGWEHPSAQAL
jgi:hypothetical protein